MPSQVRLNFARVECREIFVDLLENRPTRLFTKALAKEAEKFRLHHKSQSLIAAMKSSLFDAVGDSLREFFAFLLAQRRPTRGDVDEVFNLPQVWFKSPFLEDSSPAAVGDDNPDSVSHGAPFSVIGWRLGGHRKSSHDDGGLAGQRRFISIAHR